MVTFRLPTLFIAAFAYNNCSMLLYVPFYYEYLILPKNEIMRRGRICTYYNVVHKHFMTTNTCQPAKCSVSWKAAPTSNICANIIAITDRRQYTLHSVVYRQSANWWWFRGGEWSFWVVMSFVCCMRRLEIDLGSLLSHNSCFGSLLCGGSGGSVLLMCTNIYTDMGGTIAMKNIPQYAYE